MPQYFYAPKLIGTNHAMTRIRFGLRDELEHERLVDSYYIDDDVDILMAALVDDSTEYRFKRTSDSATLDVRDGNIRGITGVVREKIKEIVTLRSSMQGHNQSEFHLLKLERQDIIQHFLDIRRLSHKCFGAVLQLDEKTDNTIGSIFRHYIIFEPGDDLIRDYQFRGGMRRLVIPNIGNYDRIELPDELSCTNSDCRIGRLCGSIRDLNNLAAQIDWHCLQIAHKMKDHQETTIPNGPYWVI